jgi:BirA family biotin operon repressor/biotin-[acetyl-CoA-carboxylase] ligase
LLIPDQLSTIFTGKQFNYLPTCHSTNSLAEELVLFDSIPSGYLVITAHQTNGKGQFGNTWDVEPGLNLTFSVIYKDINLPVCDQFFLNIITSLAVYQTLDTYVSKKIAVKWPNDIYCNHKKVAGILIKNYVRGSQIKNTIIGIGLNVNQEKFSSAKATSMQLLEGKVFDLSEILRSILENLEVYFLKLLRNENKSLKDLYLQSLYLYNQNHQFESPHIGKFEGKIQGIDSLGNLEVLVDNQLKTFGLKEISYSSSE